MSMSEGNDFDRNEVASIYAHRNERFVVSLVVGYDPSEGDVLTPKSAAASALELTRNDGSNGTVWFVYDRQTGQLHQFEQDEFEPPYDRDLDGWCEALAATNDDRDAAAAWEPTDEVIVETPAYLVVLSDKVDLEGDMWADPENSDPLLKGEFVEVAYRERKNEGCMILGFEGFGQQVAFPPEHKLRVRKDPDAIYAYPYDTLPTFPYVADAWYHQQGDRWMAVVRDWEPEGDWFGDTEADGVSIPTPRTYHIDQRPPFGTLAYRRFDGTEVTEPA